MTMIVLLGPVPCNRCKTPVIWARPSNTRPAATEMIRWRDAQTWHIHTCIEGDTK